MSERWPTTVCGRTIGTHEEFDLLDDIAFIFYAFEPNELAARCGLSKGALAIDYETGRLEQQDEASGQVLVEKDLVEVLQQFEKDKT